MEKTIAAVSTGLTPSGISVIRISGPEAVDIADRIFRGKKHLKEVPSHTIHHGFICDGERDIDEVLVSVMKGPHTLTGEDVAEINSHGGILVTKTILELLFSKGAVPAEPGEFTKRAFLNGRMDLSKAEAVIDVIEAKNDFSLRASVSQLKGAVSKKVRELRESILDEVSYIEAALDDPEHYDIDGYGETLYGKVENAAKEISRLVKTADDGAMLREGIRTVIAGRPNAGKSSLLNLLSGHEKAIVTDIAGTTRDVLEVPVRFGGISLLLMDTAGLRDTKDEVERIGVDRAKDALENADLVLYVIDGTEGETEEDRKILSSLEEKAVIVLYNKSDLSNGFSVPEGAMPFSVKTEDGLSLLEKKIETLFCNGLVTENEELVITSSRHKALLSEAADSLELALSAIRDWMPEDFWTIDLVNAYTALGKIIGEEVGDDVIDRIFEKFCMGK